MALDTPHIVWVARETDDLMVVFGEGDDRFDIQKNEIKFASRNVLIYYPSTRLSENTKSAETIPCRLTRYLYHPGQKNGLRMLTLHHMKAGTPSPSSTRV